MKIGRTRRKRLDWLWELWLLQLGEDDTWPPEEVCQS